jgi:xylonate dehydratase
VNFVGEDAASFVARPMRDDLRADPNLPADTRLWAALQQASGGIWGGCVYDADAIMKKLGA